MLRVKVWNAKGDWDINVDLWDGELWVGRDGGSDGWVDGFYR